jgi:hypothetical protein
LFKRLAEAKEFEILVPKEPRPSLKTIESLLEEDDEDEAADQAIAYALATGLANFLTLRVNVRQLLGISSTVVVQGSHGTLLQHRLFTQAVVSDDELVATGRPPAFRLVDEIKV